jgi:RNA polymerase sigma-70 factor, ECF subfamily
LDNVHHFAQLSGGSEASFPIGLLSTANSAGRMTLEDQISQWFTDWRDSIYRSLLSAGARPAEAEEITQEAFLKAFRYLHEGKKLDNPQFWLFRVAHNLRVDRIRSRRHESAQEVDAAEHVFTTFRDRSPSPEETAIQRQRLDRVHVAMQSLTDMQRNCLQLRAEGFLNREIAQMLGIGMSSVGDALRRAINRLTKAHHE